MNTVNRNRIAPILRDINNLYAATIESENRRSVLNRIERIHNEIAALAQPEQRRTSALDIARAAGMPVQPQQPEQEYHRVFEANESLEESLAEQPEAGRGVCSRCHGVDGDCDALMSDDPTACPCRCHEPQVQDEGPTPYEAEHPSEGNVGRYYGEAAGANTWDIYRPDGSFLAHIDRPGVFYAILDELNKLNATTRPQAQEANAEAVELLARLVAIANERPFVALGHVLEHEVPAVKILVGNSAAAQEGL